MLANEDRMKHRFDGRLDSPMIFLNHWPMQSAGPLDSFKFQACLKESDSRACISEQRAAT